MPDDVADMAVSSIVSFRRMRCLDVSVCVCLWLSCPCSLLAILASLGTVLTLPGIAGFVLTIGIGVDSNVLVFERIKEELEAGRPVRAAVDAGYRRVFRTLLDTHVAAFISAALLFQFGSSAVQGFAVTLAAGLAANLYTSTFVSRTLFELSVHRSRTPSISI